MMQRILVVNDRREILELFDKVIPHDTYELFLYSYRMDEVRAVEHLKPALLILDFTPGYELDGWELLQKVKMLSTLAEMRVIICALPTQQVRESEGYLRSQGVFVLPKPFTTEALLRLIATVLGLPITKTAGNGARPAQQGQ
jgi:CheY-like chemotaxis protein